MKIIQSPVKPPNPTTTSAELSKLIMWLLQKDPVNRPCIRDILCEQFVQEKLEEHNLEIPSDILEVGVITNYLGEESGASFKQKTASDYSDNGGDADGSTRSAINSNSDADNVAQSQQTCEKKARSLNHPMPNSISKAVKSVGAIRGNRVRGPPSAKRVLSEQVLTAHQMVPPRVALNPFSNKRQSAGSRTNSSNSAASSGHNIDADEKPSHGAESKNLSFAKEDDNDATLVAGAKQEKLTFTVGLHAFSKGELGDDDSDAVNVCAYPADSKDDNSNHAGQEVGEDSEDCNYYTDNYSYEDDFEEYDDIEAKSINSKYADKDEVDKKSSFYNIYFGSDTSTKNDSTSSSNDNNNDDDNNSTGEFEIDNLTALATENRNKLCAMLGKELFTKVYDLCSCRMRRNNMSGDDDEKNVSAYVEDEDGEMIDSQIDDRNFVAELEILFTNSKKNSDGAMIDFSDALVGVQVLLAYEFKLYCLERSRYSEEYLSLVCRK